MTPLQNTISGWMTNNELEAINELAKTAQPNGVIVEVGSWIGRSATMWAQSADPTVTIYCFDPFNQWEEFKKNTNKFSNIIPVRGMVPVDTAYTDPRQIDVFFLDASHYNPSDWEIIKHFLPFIKPGGIVAGHDYTVYRKDKIKYPDVNLNVHRLEENFKRKASMVDTLWSLKMPEKLSYDINRY